MNPHQNDVSTALPREAATIEFKSNLEDPVEICQYLSALANAAAIAGEEVGI